MVDQSSEKPRQSGPRRWFLFYPFDLLARFWPVFGKPRGVLVVRIDGIGDMVLFHPAFAHYAQALGVAPSDITLLGCQSWAALAPVFFPGIKFHAIDEHAYDRSPLYRFKVSLWLRRQNFAVALLDSFMRKPLVADSLIYVSGAPTRIVAKPYLSPKDATAVRLVSHTLPARRRYRARIRRMRSRGISPLSRRLPAAASRPSRRACPGARTCRR